MLRAVILVVLFAANVLATSKVSSLTYLTNSANKYECGTSNVTCNGGWHRKFSDAAPTNVIPQEANVLLKYHGSLAEDKYLSLVDSSLHNGNPCVVPAIAAAAADNLHSGPLQGVAEDSSQWSDHPKKIVTVPQSTAATMLDASKTYVVCYAEGDGSVSDATWATSNIMIKVTKLFRIQAYKVDHRTTGTIPNHLSLTMYYFGTLLQDRWISLIDDSLNANKPCEDGRIAAAPADSKHSGSKLAAGNVFTVETADLSATSTFAVCYAESGGITSSVWKDSGIRVKRSAITKVAYGVDTVRFGEGSRRESWNRNTDDPNGIATDTLPQASGAKLEYVGELQAGARISLVDSAGMDPDAGATYDGNPCMYPVIAAEAQSIISTGTMTGQALTGGAPGKVVTIPQTSALLDATKVFAVCYSEDSGQTWRDSYIRMKISKLEGLSHHSAAHTTFGHLPWSIRGVGGQDLVLMYSGSLPVGSANVKFGFVDSTKNQVTTNSITISQPCLNAAQPNTAPSNAGEYSGPLTATTNRYSVEVDTTVMHTGSISGDTLVKKYFAVCYSEDGGTSYADSGIRVTVSKVYQIEHGRVDAPYLVRTMDPISATMLPSGLAAATNVLPQAANQEFTYISNWNGNQGALTGSTNLMEEKYFSLIDASLNAGKPCVQASIAAAAADSQHSGSLKAAAGTKTIAVPQATLLDASKTFAVCYAITSGTVADPTWADSYIRVTISKIQAITSLMVEHKVNGYISHIADRSPTETRQKGHELGAWSDDKQNTWTQSNLLDITYSGTLGDNKYLALVDDTLGTVTNFPCGSFSYNNTDVTQLTGGGSYHYRPGTHPGSQVGSGQSTGKVQAGTSDKVVLMKTNHLLTTKSFAMCYSDDNSFWFDSGIRVRKSEVEKLSESSMHTGTPERDITTVFHSTNVLPNIASREFTYHGDLVAAKWITLKDATGNNNDPCVKGSAGALASGVMQGSGTKVVTVDQSGGFIDTSLTVAVCYSSDNTNWYDTYIRFKVSQLGTVAHDIGKFKSTTGLTIKYYTMGSLPHQYKNAHGLGITYEGDLAVSKWVSFVHSYDTSTKTMLHGISYYNPCDTATNAAASMDSTHSGPLQASTGTKKVETLDSTGLSTAVQFAVCYTAGTTGTASDLWRDSGLRVTFSKVENAQYASGYTGINARDQTSTFYPTNTIPIAASIPLTYRGDLASGKYLSLVDATTNSNNPCVPSTAANGVGGKQASAGASSRVVAFDTSSLTSNTIYAVCYSQLREIGSTNDHGTLPGYECGSVTLSAQQTNFINVWGATHAATCTTPSPPTVACNTVTVEATCNGHATCEYVSGACQENKLKPARTDCEADADCAGFSFGMHDGETCIFKEVNEATAALANVGITALGAEATRWVQCVKRGSGTNSVWHDSFIRLRASPVVSLEVGGTVIQTSGHIPNVDKTFPNSVQHYAFKYVGSQPVNREIAFVDITSNDWEPCAQTATDVSNLPATRKVVTIPDTGTKTFKPTTNTLDTFKTFAVCARDGGATYVETGIRVTVTRVWNVLYASGTTVSPACPLPTQGPINTGCKEDNKPRDMTSAPLATNILPQEAGMMLTYKGTLPNGAYISLVDASLNTKNPCISGAIAGAAADQLHSGPLLAQGASVTIPQTTLLNATKTYAVCYDDNAALPPYHYSTVMYPYDATGSSYHTTPSTGFPNSRLPTLSSQSSLIGTANSATWRDSFIRIKISKVTSLKVAISKMPVANAYDYQRVLTHGQIPNQAASQQVHYEYTGSLPDNMWLALTLSSHSGGAGTQDTDTEIQRALPCSGTQAGEEVHPAPSVAVGTGRVQAGGANKVVTTLDSTTLNSATTFALCYSEDGSTFSESGIRITVSELTSIKYLDTKFGNEATLSQAKYRRTLDSITKAINMFPQATSQQFNYDGSLASGKWVSVIESTQNSKNPCVDPTVAAAAVSTNHSGVDQADGDKLVEHTQSTLLGGANPIGKIFAVCYSKTDGSSTDLTWRDSYIRFSMSRVESINSYMISHRVWGQIANHPELKIDYVGSLQNNKYLVLVDQTLNSQSFTSGLSASFPCADAAIATPAATFGNQPTTDSQHSNVGKGVSFTYGANELTYSIGSGKTTIIDTTALDTTKVFALCYSSSGTADGGEDNGNTYNWNDSGIRLELPKIINVQAGSGYSGVLDNNAGIPLRDQRSWDQLTGMSLIDRPTSRHPRVAGVKVNYVTHSTAPSTNDAYIALVDSSKNSNDPCTKSSHVHPAGVASTGHAQGRNLAGTGSGTIVTVPQSTLLDETATFAVCYKWTGDADNEQDWRDSYVRLKITKVTSLTVSGVTLTTFGQIPNVAATDLNKFRYAGDLADDKWIAFVSETEYQNGYNNVGRPCDNVANTPSVHVIGQATGASKIITSFNTQSLNSTHIYAVCYSSTSGTAGYADSGIRVTVPRVWNMKAKSGFGGPACPMVNTDNNCHGIACPEMGFGTNSMLNNNCKLDTKDRDMTSKPLATNVLARAASQKLTYVGTMAKGKYISIVRASDNSNNPCVSGAFAGAAASATASGPLTAPGGSTEITIPQSTLLAAGKYAVCYDDGMDMTSTDYPGYHRGGTTTTVYSTVTARDGYTTAAHAYTRYLYVEANEGQSASKTWRDSYIRLTTSEVEALRIVMFGKHDPNAHKNVASPTVNQRFLDIRTTGQVMNQEAERQVAYQMIQSVTFAPNMHDHIVLVDADSSLANEEDSDTGITVTRPCTIQTTIATQLGSHYTVGVQTGQVANSFTGVKTATTVGNTRIVETLDTTSLLADKVYAVCYSKVGGAVAPTATTQNAFMDSGIRVTVPKLSSVNYLGQNSNDIAARTRTMTSLVYATNKLPAGPNQQLVYSGDLGANKYVSIVDATLNGNNPCVDPLVAAATASSAHTGAVLAAVKVATFPQSTLLDAAVTKFYTICYSDGGDGSTTDLKWRDSYIRVSMSKIETVDSHLVSHRTTGQLADHPRLTFNYAGSLGAGMKISLVQADLNMGTIGKDDPATNSFAFPCSEANAEASADTKHTGASVAASGNKTVYFNTQNLQRYDAVASPKWNNEWWHLAPASAQVGTAAGGIQQYAVCYSEGDTANPNTEWVDAGIRLTITAIYEVLLANSNIGPTNKEDTMPRHISSQFLSTNVFPREAGQALSYSSHTSSRINTTHYGETEEDKFLSLVDASQNSNNPCVLKAQAGQAADSTHTGGVQASGVKVTFVQNPLLDASKTYAVCYAVTDGTVNDDSWADSYIRLKLTKITSISMLGTVTTTVGQLPNTAAAIGQWNQPASHADGGIYLEYTGDLAANQKISLVDASSAFPCSAAMAATAAQCTSSAQCTTGTNSGVHTTVTGTKKVYTLETSGLATNLGSRLTTTDYRYLDDQPDSSYPAYAWGQSAIGAFALCYAEGSGNELDSTWADSGIRVTVPKLHTVTYSSEYSGTKHRYMTANRASTNRLPKSPDILWTYYGPLADSQRASVVLATLNNNNPCVHPGHAAASVTAGGTANDERTYSGVIVAGSAAGSTNRDITIPQGANDLLKSTDAGTTEFALCYTDGDGSATDVLWRDSYIRVATSDVLSFKFTFEHGNAQTRSVDHRTYGQIPDHAAGLEYEYIGSLANAGSIALVDEKLGSQSYPGHQAISQPCDCDGAACNDLVKVSTGFQHSGDTAAGAGVKKITTLNTLTLSTSVLRYALCYALPGATNFHDSGIRLTVPKITGIQYSGYSQPVATARNKRTRLIQSVLPALQPVAEISANVLPQQPNLPLVYVGDLPGAMWISLVAVKNAMNDNNPCVNPAMAAAAADALHSGPLRSCHSLGGSLCPAIGVDLGGAHPQYSPGRGTEVSAVRPTTIVGHTYYVTDDHAHNGDVCYKIVVGVGIYAGMVARRASASGCSAANFPSNNYHIGNVSHVPGYQGIVEYFVDGAHDAACSTADQRNRAQLKVYSDPSVTTNYTAVVTQASTCDFVFELHVNPSLLPPAPPAPVVTYDPHSVGIVSGNKEFTIPQTVKLSEDEIFTVCYSEVDGTTTDITWRDSYIRVRMSEVTAIVATGVTHTDHGHIANHEATVKLQVDYQGGLAQNKHLSFVDETKGTGASKHDPCSVPGIAAAGSDTEHSGSVTATVKTAAFDTDTLSVSKQFAVCYASAAGNNADNTWRDTGIRVMKTRLHTIRYNNAQLPTASVTTTIAQFLRETTSSRVTVGGTNYARTYDDQVLAKLPQISVGSLDLSYYGDLGVNKYLNLVSTAENFGDPCVKSSIADNTTATTSRTGRVTAAGTKEFSFPVASMSALKATNADGSPIVYTVCYGEFGTASNPPAANTLTSGSSSDPAYSGKGVYADGWRDSYVRFTLTTVAHIQSHSIKHYTQGHIANVGTLAITTSGSFPASQALSLVEETHNSNEPCLGSLVMAATVTGTDRNIASGAMSQHPLPSTARSVVDHTYLFDTRRLDTTKQFAVCYRTLCAQSQTCTQTSYDSGIRVTVSKITTITYNNDQPGTASTEQYKRIMDSSNTCMINGNDTCNDVYPLATNRIGSFANLKYIYEGNEFHNGAASIGTSIGNNMHISVVSTATTLNADQNPCANRVEASGAATAGGSNDARIRSGVSQAGAADKEVTILQAAGNTLDGSLTMAVCYATTAGDSNDVTWRDSYIRLKVSKIHKITSYGIDHFTTGMIASRDPLRVKATGTMGAPSSITLVEEGVDSYQPCNKAGYGGAGTALNDAGNTGFASLETTSGTSTSFNAITGGKAAKYSIITDKLSVSKTFALCYTMDSANAGNTEAWEDSGIRLQTPKLTSIRYSHPIRELKADSCFPPNLDLWGVANCQGGDTTVTNDGADVSGGSTAYRNSQLPRDENTVFTYYGPTGGLANNAKIALVDQTRGSQTANPCRDGKETSAAADSQGTPDNRQHSGMLTATGNSVVLPQTLGANTGSSAGTGHLLADSGTYAVCYAEGDGSQTDTTWRDSYIRITFSKIHTLKASDMVVTTIGAFANVPSLRISWTGSLGDNSWISIVDATQNSNFPCDKAYAGSAGFRKPYIATQDSTGVNANRTQNIQSGPGMRMIDIDTSKLFSPTNTGAGSNMYRICYAEGNGDNTDATWRDSGMSLRFIRWKNGNERRFVSGAASLLNFGINQGTFGSTDKLAILWNKTDCTAAPGAPTLSNTMQVQRSLTGGSSSASVALPSGTGVVNLEAIAYHTCTFGPCDSPGQYGDFNLMEGSYILCFCDSHHGDGACDQPNEFIKLTRNDAGDPDPAVKIISTPRLGGVGSSAAPSNIRAVESHAHVYHIKGSDTEGYEVADGDKIFFKQDDCNNIPSLNAASSTAPINLTNYDFSLNYQATPSSTHQTAQVVLPTTLAAHSGVTNNLVACFATAESLLGDNVARDYVRLPDGLEVMASPRLGPAGNPGHIRSLNEAVPTFLVTPMKHGDRIYFKQQATAFGQVSDCTLGANQVNGAVISAIPAANGPVMTVPLEGSNFLSDEATINLARDRPTMQSSEDHGGLSHRAVDGSDGGLMNKYDSGSCMHTKRELNPHWRVDLGSSTSVHRVVIHNRDADYDYTRLAIDMKDYIVAVGDHPDWSQNPVCGFKQTLAAGESQAVKCGLAGRYVFVVLPGSDRILSMCEVEVFGGTGTGKITLPAGMKSNAPSNSPAFLAACFIPRGVITTLYSGMDCPVDNANMGANGGTNANGGTCNTTLLNVVKLTDELQLFTEPTQALVTSWFKNHVYELKFTQPQFGVYGTKTFSAGYKGDFVVLQKDNCDDVHAVTSVNYVRNGAAPRDSHAHSAKMTLEEYGTFTDHRGHVGDEKGGAALIKAVAQGKLNELPVGIYKICYATAESDGDDPNDYKQLGESFEILPTTATRPSMSTPRSVLLGNDIVVHWESTVQLQTRLQSQNSWVGLYENGTCMGTYGRHGDEWTEHENRVIMNQFENQYDITPMQKLTDTGRTEEYVESTQHECHISWQFIEGGVQSGVVRFSQKDYKNGGLYNIRFFQGDSRNVQGRICRGLTNVNDETYVQCILEANLISEPIEVFADPHKVDNFNVIPGMEVMFDDSRARYQKFGRTKSRL